MATCKDCLHCEACTSMLEAMGYTVDGDGLDADKRCSTFASKSALDILVAHAVCSTIGLSCDEYCPFIGMENPCDGWDNSKLIDAVKLLNRRATGDT